MTSASFTRRGVLAATPIVLATGALAACSSGGTSTGSGSDGGGEAGRQPHHLHHR